MIGSDRESGLMLPVLCRKSTNPPSEFLLSESVN